MKTITFFGEIGAELFAVDFAAELKDAGKEDILIKFSSIGGSIFEGGDIYNVLADHRRDYPKIRMNLEIKSIAASMGSLLAASPVWDEVTVEPNTMLMLHNPLSFAIGDFVEMRKTADFLESARDMYSKIYGARSGKGIEEIKEIMNEVTWYFGEEIIKAGFADRVLQDETSQVPQDRVVIMASMEAKFAEMKKRQRDRNTSETFDTERAAACLRAGAELKENKNNPRTRQTRKTHEGKLKIKTDFSEKYPEIYKEAVQDGIKKEKLRIKKLLEMKKQPEFKGFLQVAEVLDKAVAEGTGLDGRISRTHRRFWSRAAADY